MTETEDYDKSAKPTAHKTSHEDGGSDEISLVGLPKTDFTLLDLQEVSDPETPGENISRIYTTEESEFSVLNIKTESGVIFRLGQDRYCVARNTSGAGIAKGKLVYLSGSTGNKPNFSMAKADSVTTMPTIGITTALVSNNAFAQILIVGQITGVDTSAWAEGDDLYTCPDFAGCMTNVHPTLPDLGQWIGTVEISHGTTGKILISTRSVHGEAHKTNHQDGGPDEISVDGLSGLLADEQNAGKIKGVVINDTDKADQKVLGWDEATNRIVYLAMAAAGVISLDLFDAPHPIVNTITVAVTHAIT